MPCPLCKSSREFLPVRITGQDGHIHKYSGLYDGQQLSAWKVCGDCGFLHQNPRPSIEALNAFYLNSEYHTKYETPPSVEDYLEFGKWYYAEKTDYLLKAIGPDSLSSKKVFDIGFGHGGFLKQFADREWEVYGVEADKNHFAFAKNDLGLKGPGVQLGILDRKTDIGTQVDVVISNHAFEHFSDLHEIMESVQKILKKGGYIFTVVPTPFSNRSRLSKKWMNASHYSMFGHHSLNHLMGQYGFEEVHHTYRGWWKEIDEIWHVAQFTGKVFEANAFVEDPRKVQFYMNVINPLRSAAYFPIFHGWAIRLGFFNKWKRRIRLLFSNPGLAFKKLTARVKAA
ncbi:class I SAM-dependent methyltransferase [bacterium]|nr:class I SAM-dependent methyltransferase [bacterium]